MIQQNNRPVFIEFAIGKPEMADVGVRPRRRKTEIRRLPSIKIPSVLKANLVDPISKTQTNSRSVFPTLTTKCSLSGDPAFEE